MGKAGKAVGRQHSATHIPDDESNSTAGPLMLLIGGGSATTKNAILVRLNEFELEPALDLAPVMFGACGEEMSLSPTRPLHVQGHAAVWTGRELVAFGGRLRQRPVYSAPTFGGTMVVRLVSNRTNSLATSDAVSNFSISSSSFSDT